MAEDEEIAEIVIHDSHLEETGGSVRISALMHAPVETIWEVITSCEYARSYLAGMEDCEVAVSEPHRALTHHVVDPGWFSPRIDYWFETRRQPWTRMDIELTEGNLREMTGYWQFEVRDGEVLVEHQVSLRPSVPAPRWLVRRKLERDLPSMMACIRGLADGSPSAQVRQRDLAACPGPLPEAAQ